MRSALADELEEFVTAGALWDPDGCAAQIDRLLVEATSTRDPIPERLGRFLRAVQLRTQVSDVSNALRDEVEAIVYPRLWKVIEGVRDGMPDSELQTRIEVMNRRLARLFVEETL